MAYTHTVTAEKSATVRLAITLWGGLARIRRPMCSSAPSRGVRGCVRGFSRAASFRLRRRVAQSYAAPWYLVTVTYGSEWPSHRDAKSDLRVVLQRWVRLCERAQIRTCVLWRLETQRRGAPHFHLLVWQSGRPRESLTGLLRGRAARCARTLRQTWRSRSARTRPLRPGRRADHLVAWSSIWADRIAGDREPARKSLASGVDVRRINDAAQAASYCAKYLAKPPEGGFDGAGDVPAVDAGRWWGMVGDRGILDLRSLCRLAAADTDAIAAELDAIVSPYRVQESERTGLPVPSNYWEFLPREAIWRVVDLVCRLWHDARPPPPGWRLQVSPLYIPAELA